MAPRKPAPAPEIESGEVETEQRQDAPVPSDAQHEAVVQFPASVLPAEAELTGPEVAEIRARNDTVDKAAKAVETLREEWVQASRMAQYGQEALTALIRELIKAKGLDPDLRYRVDIERGRIVPMQPNG